MAPVELERMPPLIPSANSTVLAAPGKDLFTDLFHFFIPIFNNSLTPDS